MQIVVIAVYLHICFVQCAYAFFSSVILVMFTQKYNCIYSGVLELVFENVISRVHTVFMSWSFVRKATVSLFFLRVRLVERGSPHSLPLMESGKVPALQHFQFNSIWLCVLELLPY